MDSVAERLRAEFKQSGGFNHSGEKGTAREKLVVDVITKYLPGHVQAFHSGEIVSADGQVSKQCDILICDRSTPPLVDMDSYRVVPNECVYGVVEVKSKLNRQELRGACENIRAAKLLPKTAYVPHGAFQTRYRLYGKTYDYQPTYGIIFAFDSVDMEKLGEHFAEWCAEYPPDECPDSIWVLGKGYFTWLDEVDHHPQVSPTPGSPLCHTEPGPSGDVLLPFVLYLNMYFAQSRMNPLRLLDYAGSSTLGVPKHKWLDVPLTEERDGTGLSPKG